MYADGRTWIICFAWEELCTATRLSKLALIAQRDVTARPDSTQPSQSHHQPVSLNHGRSHIVFQFQFLEDLDRPLPAPSVHRWANHVSRRRSPPHRDTLEMLPIPSPRGTKSPVGPFDKHSSEALCFSLLGRRSHRPEYMCGGVSGNIPIAFISDSMAPSKSVPVS